MFIIVSELEIEAEPLAVYNVIADLVSYKEWNPFNTANVEGPVAEGDTFSVNSNLGDRKMTVTHRMLEMKPGRKFKWCDTGFFTHFAYGERTRYLIETEHGTNYRCELKISGILSWIVNRQFSRQMQSSMDAEAEALKVRAVSQPDVERPNV